MNESYVMDGEKDNDVISIAQKCLLLWSYQFPSSGTSLVPPPHALARVSKSTTNARQQRSWVDPGEFHAAIRLIFYIRAFAMREGAA